MKTKYCPTCEKEKSIYEFWKHKTRKGGRQSVCKKCHYEYNKKKDKEKCRAAAKRYLATENGKRKAKNNQLKCYYNITIEDFEQMYKEQDGVCAICGNPEMNRLLAVDHDHKTNEIRGLLCTRCNLSLEWYLDFQKSIKNYLE